jgi:hypothetical protein
MGKFRDLKRDDIIGKIDPDVYVESRLLSEAAKMKRMGQLMQVTEIVGQDPTANRRYLSKKVASLAGLEQDEIDMALPPTVDEMLAEEQNEELSENRDVPVLPDDNHNVHIEIHQEARPTEAVFAHVEAHKMALKLQRSNPELFPQLAQPGVPNEAAEGMLPGQGGDQLPAENRDQGRVLQQPLRVQSASRQAEIANQERVIE